MVQARGIMLRENVKTIGHMIRLYTNKNTTLNGTDYPEGNNSSDCVAQTTMYLPENFTYSPYQACPEKLPYMRGLIDVNMSEISFDEIQQLFSKDLDIEPGGHWKPKDCKPRWKVAILIPFRNRHEHLPIFFRHLIPMLQKQRLEFAFYVVEQTGTQPFNRAMLFNVGFKEAMKDAVWDCIIFHDVDHLPENDRNYYGCGEMPRHFAAKLDKYMYILPYNEFFGGVSGLTVEQFKKINGFPNAFWGWGGEDDDLWNRVHYAGYNVTRPEGDLGKYKSIPHHHRGEVQFLGRRMLSCYPWTSSLFWVMPRVLVIQYLISSTHHWRMPMEEGFHTRALRDHLFPWLEATSVCSVTPSALLLHALVPCNHVNSIICSFCNGVCASAAGVLCGAGDVTIIPT
ncbi:beta-1,4-galactosyltransferase 6 isoform X2 [Pseudopipra pipra]